MIDIALFRPVSDNKRKAPKEVSVTLNQLRYFCAAAQCHSITQAARQMFVTQPAVSLAIRELEKEFSIALFNYSNNRRY